MRAIVDDIVDDDKQPIDVVGRLRSLLKKGALERSSLDMSELLRQVARLVAADAVLRGVVIQLELAPDLPPVAADRVQPAGRHEPDPRRARRDARFGHREPYPAALDGCRDSITEVGDVPVDPAWAVALWRDVLPAPPIHARVLI